MESLACLCSAFKGAALGTVIARHAGLIVTGFLFSNGNMFKGPIRDYFDYNKRTYERIIKTTTPTSTNKSSLGCWTDMYAAAFNQWNDCLCGLSGSRFDLEVMVFFSFLAAFSVGMQCGSFDRSETWKTRRGLENS